MRRVLTHSVALTLGAKQCFHAIFMPILKGFQGPGEKLSLKKKDRVNCFTPCDAPSL